MKKFWNVISNVLVIVFMGTCTASFILSDIGAKKVNEQTRYFKITNKDYTDVSSSMFNDNYKHVIYFNRYDENKKYIKCSFTLNKVAVSKYNYDRLKVGKLYKASEIDLMTYGYY